MYLGFFFHTLTVNTFREQGPLHGEIIFVLLCFDYFIG